MNYEVNKIGKSKKNNSDGYNKAYFSQKKDYLKKKKAKRSKDNNEH